ncbi:MAG: metallophosphoesterase, partial [Cyclobacteriaceae bacterium]|nr:metallophosphoesterase [Cyclobacteriaceae bacterium]
MRGVGSVRYLYQLLFVMLIWSSCNQPEKPISFGVLADCQYCDCPPVGSRFYRNSPAKLREAMNDLRNRDLDFTVHLGDLIDRNYSSYDSVLPIVSRLRNFYHVLGNHDFSVTDDEKQQVLHKIGLEKGWYDFSLRGWRFIVLDGNDISLYSSTDSLKTKQALNRIAQLKSDGAPNANDWNGAIGSEQLQWMEGAIQDAGKKGEQVILFCHFPIGPDDAHNLLNDVEVRAVLEKYDHVVAWL